MSKPRYRWWGYVKAVLRAYPEHRRELEALKQSKTTASYGGAAGAGGAGKPVESIALRALGEDEQREYDAVERLLAGMEKYPDGEERKRLLDMVFFRKTHTLEGAALKLHIDYSTAKRWQQAAIRGAAIELGLLHLEPKKPKGRAKIKEHQTS